MFEELGSDLKYKRDYFLSEYRKVAVFEKLAERRFKGFEQKANADDQKLFFVKDDNFEDDNEKIMAVINKINELYQENVKTSELAEEIVT